MDVLQTVTEQCPWCGELIELTVDLSYGDHSSVEDCSVCCAPMQVRVSLPFAADAEDGAPTVWLAREND